MVGFHDHGFGSQWIIIEWRDKILNCLSIRLRNEWAIVAEEVRDYSW